MEVGMAPNWFSSESWTLQQILQILVVPLIAVLVAIFFPWLQSWRRRRAFVALIRREIGEIGPNPNYTKPGGRWPEHLKKRFMHEETLEKLSENRDFILSLDPTLAYNLAQLWTHYSKASDAENVSELAEHGRAWRDYLKSVCEYLDDGRDGKLNQKVCVAWQALIIEYHPDS